jgi:hypothetical protein
LGIFADQLNWIARYRSISSIATDTGLTQYFVRKYMDDDSTMPESDFGAVHSLYQRTVAVEMFKSGAPEHQASLFISAAPDVVESRIDWIKRIASNMTTAHLAQQAYNEDIPDSQLNNYIKTNFDDLYGVIVERLQKSEKPFSEWSDYPS